VLLETIIYPSLQVQILFAYVATPDALGQFDSKIQVKGAIVSKVATTLLVVATAVLVHEQVPLVLILDPVGQQAVTFATPLTVAV